MMSSSRRQAKLYVNDDRVFLPTVQAFVEKTALGFGLGQREALALTLAGEEIFQYLCDTLKPGAEVEIRCEDGMYYAALDFTLPFSGFALEAFNLTARVRVEDESSLAAMGLLIASRMVDRLQLGRLADNRLQLSLRKEKSYPRMTVQGAGSPPALGKEFLVVAPAPEELKFLVGESLGRTAPALLPPEFYYPGKVVDMVASGDYRAAIVRDGVGRIGGGILWRWSSERMVECCGPYLLAEAEDNSAAAKSRRRMLAEALLEHCLNRIAKSPAVGLVNLYPSSDLPAGHFESLGAIFEYRSTAPPVERGALFRQLQEDPGALVWGHPQLEDFLRGEYRRLVLPRELRLTADDGEDRAAASVLSSQVDRGLEKVTLYPLWPGRDIERNLAEHLALFAREGLNNIFFVMDLGDSRQASFTPALLHHGFTPRLLLPYGGRGDLVLLQKTEGFA
ncbi:MAG: hypothetical protein JXR89_08410 [Deltaproteobacteria bacterium]|nr:hypothetical protein [Deltaproteobacteria bacterium]